MNWLAKGSLVGQAYLGPDIAASDLTWARPTTSFAKITVKHWSLVDPQSAA